MLKLGLIEIAVQNSFHFTDEINFGKKYSSRHLIDKDNKTHLYIFVDK